MKSTLATATAEQDRLKDEVESARTLMTQQDAREKKYRAEVKLWKTRTKRAEARAEKAEGTLCSPPARAEKATEPECVESPPAERSPLDEATVWSPSLCKGISVGTQLSFPSSVSVNRDMSLHFGRAAPHVTEIPDGDLSKQRIRALPEEPILSSLRTRPTETPAEKREYGERMPDLNDAAKRADPYSVVPLSNHAFRKVARSTGTILAVPPSRHMHFGASLGAHCGFWAFNQPFGVRVGPSAETRRKGELALQGKSAPSSRKARAPNNSVAPELVAAPVPAEAFDDAGRSLNPFVGGSVSSKAQRAAAKAWSERKRKTGARYKDQPDRDINPVYRLGEPQGPPEDWFATTPCNEAYWKVMMKKGRVSSELQGLDPLTPLYRVPLPVETGEAAPVGGTGAGATRLPTAQVLAPSTESLSNPGKRGRARGKAVASTAQSTGRNDKKRANDGTVGRRASRRARK